MTHDDSVTEWIGQYKQGDRAAVQRLWERYYGRLVAMARAKLGSNRRVTDEEDAVQSAFASFCQGVEENRFPQLEDRDDLWQVLVMITARKASNLQRHERRQKRGGGNVVGESQLDQGDDAARGLEQLVGEDPTPEFAAAVVEDFDNLLNRLKDDNLRLIAFWKFEGRTNPEIARLMNCSLSAVERKLRLIRSQLT